jgi:hypothetical protein
MLRSPDARHGGAMNDIDAEVIADMRRKLAERTDDAEDYTDDELRQALRFTLLALAIEYGG